MTDGMTELGDSRRTNVSLREPLVEAATALGISLSQARESGVEAAVKAGRGRRWKLENRAAFEAYNQWIEKNGIPLEEFRTF